jgi:MoaA/NifB/PqqE/SkfB family radical SAM enzyme
LENKPYIPLMNDMLKRVFTDALKISITRPSMTTFLLKTLKVQHDAAKRREQSENAGVHVPPYMIASITDSCNLHCAGCYARAHERAVKPELTGEQWRGVFKSARELGISVILLAGGEPFRRRDIIEIAGSFGDVIFPVFTNGTLIDDETIAFLRKCKNIVPILSLEGLESETDERRGKGVFGKVKSVIEKLNAAKIFFGVSFTITRENFDSLTDRNLIQTIGGLGCKLFFYIEYIPIESDTNSLVLQPEQRKQLDEQTSNFRKEFPALFASFPGDEEMYGGCLAAGRGFIHVSASGGLEPCPFAPYSDTNVVEMPLEQAIRSTFLKQIRDEHKNLIETEGGCALWNNREWVKTLLK